MLTNLLPFENQRKTVSFGNLWREEESLESLVADWSRTPISVGMPINCLDLLLQKCGVVSYTHSVLTSVELPPSVGLTVGLRRMN